MKVHIIGPNLIDQSQGQYHVHAPGCRDMKRDGVYDWRNGKGEHASDIKTAIEVESIQDVIEYAYGDALGEGQSWRDVRSDFRFFPCVPAKLPEQSPAQYAAADQIAAAGFKSTLDTQPAMDNTEHDRLYDSAAIYARATGSVSSTMIVEGPGGLPQDRVTAYMPIVEAVRLLEEYGESAAARDLYKLAVKLGRDK